MSTFVPEPTVQAVVIETQHGKRFWINNSFLLTFISGAHLCDDQGGTIGSLTIRRGALSVHVTGMLAPDIDDSVEEGESSDFVVLLEGDQELVTSILESAGPWGKEYSKYVDPAWEGPIMLPALKAWWLQPADTVTFEWQDNVPTLERDIRIV